MNVSFLWLAIRIYVLLSVVSANSFLAFTIATLRASNMMQTTAKGAARTQ